MSRRANQPPQEVTDRTTEPRRPQTSVGPGHGRSGRGTAEAVSTTGSLTKELLDGDLQRSMGFSDFMFKVGLHYNLAGRIASEAPTPKVVRTRRWLVAIAVIAVVGAAAARAIPERRVGERVLPHDVLGEWRTDTPLYAGRGITLRRDSVVLHYGDAQASVAFPITSVQRRVRGDTTVHDVRYLQDRREAQLVLAFVNSVVPTLSVRHTGGAVWKRLSSDSSSTSRSRARRSRATQ